MRYNGADSTGWGEVGNWVEAGGAGGSGNTNYYQIPTAVTELTSSSTSEEIQAAFGGDSGFLSVVKAVEEGAFLYLGVNQNPYIYVTIPYCMWHKAEVETDGILGFSYDAPEEGSRVIAVRKTGSSYEIDITESSSSGGNGDSFYFADFLMDIGNGESVTKEQYDGLLAAIKAGKIIAQKVAQADTTAYVLPTYVLTDGSDIIFFISSGPYIRLVQISSNYEATVSEQEVIPEAPEDGKQYARKNGTWAVIEASGGGSEHTLDLSPLFDSEGSPVAIVTDEFLTEVQKAYEKRYSNIINFGSVPGVMPAIIGDSESMYFIAVNIPTLDGSGVYHTYVQIGINKTSKEVLLTSAATGFVLNGEGKKALTDNGGYAEFASPTKVVSGGSGTVTKRLSPNTLYEFGECTSLTITLASEISGIRNEYMFEFVSGTTPTMLSIPETVGWMGGEAPTIEANKTYQCSIVNNIAVIGGK